MENLKEKANNNPRYGLTRVSGGRVFHVFDKRKQKASYSARHKKSGQVAICGFRPRWYATGINTHWSDNLLSRYPLCIRCQEKLERLLTDSHLT